MAMPIAQTPILDEEEFAVFWEKVCEEEDHKVSLTPTPNLESLRQRLVADAQRRKK